MLGVQELQGADDLAGVKAGALFVKPFHLLDMVHQVAAVQVLHHEEQVLLQGRTDYHTEGYGKWMDNEGE